MAAGAMSQQQMVVEDLQEAFGFFHNIGNGSITAEELAAMVQNLNQNRTAADDFRAIVSQLEANGNDAVEIQELLAVVTRKMKEADTEEELKEAFKVFDRDQNGFISPSELRHVMINLGEKLTDQELEQMIREADLDGDGLVNFDEFVKMMTPFPLF